MEKLIELFKEYVDNHWTDTKDIEKEYWVIDDWQWFLYWTREYLYETIISKKYWFIKWLVENDEIDLWQKLFNLTKNDSRKSTICDLDNNDFSWEDTFLMLLAISDTPIEDLISYLK